MAEPEEELALQIDPGCDLDRAIPLIQAHDAALAARIFEQCAKVCRERGEAKKQDFRRVPGIGAHAAKAEALGCEAEIRELAAKFAAGVQQLIKCDYGDECPGRASPDERPCGWEPPLPETTRRTHSFKWCKACGVRRDLSMSFDCRAESLFPTNHKWTDVPPRVGTEARLFRFSFKRSPEHVDAVLFEGKPGEALFRHEGGELKIRDGVLIAPDEMVAPDGRVVRQGDVLTARAGVLLINGEAPSANAAKTELVMHPLGFPVGVETKPEDEDIEQLLVRDTLQCLELGLRWLHDRAEDDAYEEILQAARLRELR